MAIYKGNITGREQMCGGNGKQEGNTQKKENKTEKKQKKNNNKKTCIPVGLEQSLLPLYVCAYFYSAL